MEGKLLPIATVILLVSSVWLYAENRSLKSYIEHNAMTQQFDSMPEVTGEEEEEAEEEHPHTMEMNNLPSFFSEVAGEVDKESLERLSQTAATRTRAQEQKRATPINQQQ